MLMAIYKDINLDKFMYLLGLALFNLHPAYLIKKAYSINSMPYKKTKIIAKDQKFNKK